MARNATREVSRDYTSEPTAGRTKDFTISLRAVMYL